MLIVFFLLKAVESKGSRDGCQRSRDARTMKPRNNSSFALSTGVFTPVIP